MQTLRIEALRWARFCSIGYVVLFGVGSIAAASSLADRLVFSCRAENDLYASLAETLKANPPRYDRAMDAIGKAPTGGAVLILAEGYPDTATPLDAALLEAAAAKKLRVYVEFPAWLPGQTVGKPTRAPVRDESVELMRAVVASDAFGPDLPVARILSICGTSYVPSKAERSHLVLAQVAGLDVAILGIPKRAIPLLFELPAAQGYGQVLVSTSKLSQFKTGRYAPAGAWRKVWSMVFGWLLPEAEIPPLAWTPDVHPTFTRDARLPEGALREAVDRGADHYTRSRFLVHASWKERTEQFGGDELLLGPAPSADMPVGDGSLGLLEGFNSTIDYRGNQPARYFLRADCNSEAAMGLALRGLVNDDDRSRRVAANLLDFVYFHSELQRGPRGDANNPAFGLLGWNIRPDCLGNYYGDDNARAILCTLAAAAALKSDRWDASVLKCILANFRTTGRLGFRTGNLLQRGLDARGWKAFHDASPTHFSPHFEAYPWACYLWLYDKTHYEPLLERTKEGIGQMMAAYPHQWHWTNGLQQERVRMLLPLAWLVRVEDTPEHRAWLKQMVDAVVKSQVECGALREELGEAGKGRFAPPTSNEAYGTNEAPLIQANSNTISDLLYTANFALLGLNEAAAATKDEQTEAAVARLAEFLCRIQVRSDRHPELDGAWFRTFDFGRWDYWGSNSDLGWGAWCTETGWIQGWITSVLGMRLQKTCLWDLTADSKVANHMAELQKQMLPD